MSRIAYHEAGHAVVAAAVGFDLAGAIVATGTHLGGLTSYATPPPAIPTDAIGGETGRWLTQADRYRRPAEHQAVVALAGRAAELWAVPFDPPDVASDPDPDMAAVFVRVDSAYDDESSDDANVERLTFALDRDPLVQAALRDVLAEQARSILRDHEPALHRVAAALHRDRSLSGARIMDLIENQETADAT